MIKPHLWFKGKMKKRIAIVITKKPLNKAKKVVESNFALEIKKIKIKTKNIARIMNFVPLAIIEEEIDSSYGTLKKLFSFIERSASAPNWTGVNAPYNELKPIMNKFVKETLAFFLIKKAQETSQTKTENKKKKHAIKNKSQSILSSSICALVQNKTIEMTATKKIKEKMLFLIKFFIKNPIQ